MSIKTLVEHRLFTTVIMLLIVVNAIVIGLETYPNIYDANQPLFFIMNNTLLSIFTIEIVLKIFAYKKHFFRNGWNVMDFIIVVASLIFISSNFVSLLRILRVLRILRTVSVFPSLRRVVSALFLSVPAMISSLFLMIILFYIYGIIGTILFSNVSATYFGDLQLSLLTLFQVFTLEAWASEVFRPIFEIYSWSWIYFSTFIILSAFIIANIFFGELVNNAQKLAQMTETPTASDELNAVKADLVKMHKQHQLLHAKLDRITLLLEKESQIK